MCVHDACEVRVGFELDVVVWFVCELCLVVVGDVLVQCFVACDVECLCVVADCEDGYFVLECAVQ